MQLRCDAVRGLGEKLLQLEDENHIYEWYENHVYDWIRFDHLAVCVCVSRTERRIQELHVYTLTHPTQKLFTSFSLSYN
jgi:hypothetical protein